MVVPDREKLKESGQHDVQKAVDQSILVGFVCISSVLPGSNRRETACLLQRRMPAGSQSHQLPGPHCLSPCPRAQEFESYLLGRIEHCRFQQRFQAIHVPSRSSNANHPRTRCCQRTGLCLGHSQTKSASRMVPRGKAIPGWKASNLQARSGHGPQTHSGGGVSHDKMEEMRAVAFR